MKSIRGRGGSGGRAVRLENGSLDIPDQLLPPPKEHKTNSRLTIRPVHILPRIFPTNHILHLLPLHLLPVVVFVVDQELVRAGAAFEAGLSFGIGVRGGGARDGQGVGTRGTDWWCDVLVVGGLDWMGGREGRNGGRYRGALWWGLVGGER